MSKGIRPYGPGKFGTLLDAHIYDLSLDGADETAGDVDTCGWHGLLLGPFEPSEELTEDENFELTHACGAILVENSQGFVYVTTYTDRGEMYQDWKAIEAACEGSTDDEEIEQ